MALTQKPPVDTGTCERPPKCAGQSDDVVRKRWTICPNLLAVLQVQIQVRVHGKPQDKVAARGKTLLHGSGRMFSGKEELLLGVGKMLSGMEQLLPGIGRMLSGMEQLIHGIGKTISGMEHMLLGIGKMISGVEPVLLGLGQMLSRNRVGTIEIVKMPMYQLQVAKSQLQVVAVPPVVCVGAMEAARVTAMDAKAARSQGAHPIDQDVPKEEEARRAVARVDARAEAKIFMLLQPSHRLTQAQL